MQAEILLKLRIAIQTLAFTKAASMILCTALEGDASLFSAVPAYFEDGTALPKQQGAREEFSAACNPLQVTESLLCL